MHKKNWLIVLVILAALTLGACTRSATGPSTEEIAQTDTIESIFSVGATLTAQAAAAGVSPTAAVTGDLTGSPSVTAGVVTVTATVSPSAMPTPELTVPSEYTLKEGEFPYCIARRFNVDIDDLLSASGLSRGSTYYPGLKLTIPQDADSFQGERALRSHPTDYTVQAGDTIYSIACKFGDVWPEAIAAANGLEPGDALTVGEVIRIP